MPTLKHRAWKALRRPMTVAELSRTLGHDYEWTRRLVRVMVLKGHVVPVVRKYRDSVYKATALKVPEEGRGGAEGSKMGRKNGHKPTSLPKQLNGMGKCMLAECWKFIPQ